MLTLKLVQISIPLESVLSVEKSPTMEFADTIDITVVDSEDSMAVDSYFFAYFRDNDQALSDIQDLLTRFKQERGTSNEVRPIRDSTDARRSQTIEPGDPNFGRTPSTISATSDVSLPPPQAKTTLSKLASRIIPFASSSKSHSKSSQADSPSDSASETLNAPEGQYDLSASVDTVRPLPIRKDSLTYPPSRTVGPPPPGMEEKAKWGAGWRKSSEPGIPRSPSISLGPKKVTEIFSTIIPGGKVPKEPGSDDDQEYSMMEKSESGDNAENEVVDKFHKVFALDDKEVLLDREWFVLWTWTALTHRVALQTSLATFTEYCRSLVGSSSPQTTSVSGPPRSCTKRRCAASLLCQCFS